MSKTLKPGDRIAYSASFLKSIGDFTYETASRRGTYIGPYVSAPKTHSRVHWDDTPARIAARDGYFAEDDYCQEIARNGSPVANSAIAKLGSVKFSDSGA